MKYARRRCEVCEGLIVDGKCTDCDRIYGKTGNTDDNITKLATGPCKICGARGIKSLTSEKNARTKCLCLRCLMTPIWEGRPHKRREMKYSCRAEEMYYKAKYLYYDNPKYLCDPVNERVVAIAHDRLKGINRELWDQLPVDIK